MNGAYLVNAQLNGAELSHTDFRPYDTTSWLLHGAFLEGTKLKGSIFAIRFEGIYFVTGVDTSTSADWQALKRDSLFLPQKRRDEYIRRILDAEKRDTTDYLASLLKTLNPDSTKFLEARNQLACKNSYAAEGMIFKNLSEMIIYRSFGGMTDPKLRDESRAIVKHMLESCPDTLAVIVQRSARVRELVNEFRQANKK